jgi:Bacterial SH3 domain
MKKILSESIFAAILPLLVAISIQAAETNNLGGKVIVNVTEARVRTAPNLNAKVLGATKLGTVYSVVSQKTGWVNINFNAGNSGWISATVVEPFDESRRSMIYQKLAGKYLNRAKLDFDTASEVFDFLSNIQSEVTGSNAESYFAFNRLVALAAALEAAPFDKIDKAPYKTFAAANDADVVYSEPAGQYFVIADRFWDLREKYSSLPIAEEIAWKGSQTFLPGECEGFVVCHLFNLRDTTAKYLEFYPKGTHSGEAVKNVAEYLESIAAGANSDEDTGYYISSEPDDKTQLEKYVIELREIVSKTSSPLKPKILDFLETIRTGYQPKGAEETIDPEFATFWNSFKAAVIKRNKYAVAEMTQFPFQMPHLQQPVKTTAEFLKRYDAIFYGEADAAKCFENAKLTQKGVYCSFKNAPENADKPIYYYFEKTDAGYKFVGLDNINE